MRFARHREAPVTNSFNPVRILPTWVNQVLAHEHDDVRFEAFANEVVSVLEGKPIVGTSRSWDLARDGRGLGARQGTFVLTTLRIDAGKPRTDAARLKATAWKIRHVYYVAPRLVSEVVLEEHCNEIRSILGEDIQIDSIGGPQISDLVSSGRQPRPLSDITKANSPASRSLSRGKQTAHTPHILSSHSAPSVPLTHRISE